MSSDHRLRGPVPENPNLLSVVTLLREVDRFPERVAAIPQQSSGILSAAVDVVQALGRAQGAALCVVHDDRPVLAVCTVDASRLAQVFETCRAVLQSGRPDFGPVRGAASWGQAATVTFAAIPLVGQCGVIGVLYLEGPAEMSSRVDALVQKCVGMIARLLDRSECLAEMDGRPCAGAIQVERR